MNMMGMGLSTPVPDFIGQADIIRLLNLIAVVANPEASKALLEQIAKARDEAQAKADDAVTKGASIDTTEREHKKRIKRERDEHEQALATAKTGFSQECAAREKILLARENEANSLKAKAERMLQEATAAKADLDSRLEKIRAATA